MKKPELLAPAGSMSTLKAAVDAGADAVYLGLNQYNARMHADNFSWETLREALDYAHLRNSKVYITLNTLIDDDEMMDAVELALNAYMMGADAFLVQDKGLASYLSEHLPQIPLHASTQMNVYSLTQSEEMKDLGITRVVLPRELSMDEIRARAELFHENDIEVEVFVHGAMCVCYSGLCLFSAMNKSGSRSGNRGSCAQPCRQSYQIFVKPFFLDRVQHRHVKDEFLVFLGASFPNVFDFDAHIELTIGKGEEAETYIITKPTIVRIPAGVYHCPLNFKEVNKPVLFLATLFTPMFGGIYDMPDGTTREMYYNGQIECVLEPGKQCNACKKCLSIEWNK